ncbi:hypothetical protein [Heyndrickxia coagulans]|uniref:hypothetical protein n=1 Tax=Heyndrickxia coagulans TaxID=1398 RepID=UPI001C65919A|nr:hypothetical protein [Heyndrickxia coagulans]
MMISTGVYDEAYLKGKTIEEILTVICGLKQEIGRLKNTMEVPGYGMVPIMHPSEETRLHWKTKMSKYDILVQYMPIIQADRIGEGIVDKENDGTPEHPIQIPFVG